MKWRSTHFSMVNTESVDGKRCSADVLTMCDDVTRNVAAIPFNACKWTNENNRNDVGKHFLYKKLCTHQHSVFVCCIITGVDDFDSLWPVHTEGGSQNINRGTTCSCIKLKDVITAVWMGILCRGILPLFHWTGGFASRAHCDSWALKPKDWIKFRAFSTNSGRSSVGVSR